MQKKYNFMNLLRALSMIAIVFYHMVITLYIYGIRQHESISFLFENTNMHIAKVGVGLFFILSGCGLMMSSLKPDYSITKFYKKRFFKILIPFYIVYSFYFIYLISTGQMLYSNPFEGRKISPYSFIFTLLGMDTYMGVFNIPTFSIGIGEWFLGCLILMYILFPFLKRMMQKNAYITIAIATLYYLLINLQYNYFECFDNVPMYMNLTIKIYDFILGMFLATILHKLPKFTCYLGLIVNLFFVFCPIELPGIDSFQIVIQCLSAFLFFTGLENSIKKIPIVIHVSDKICKYSYEYFLIHHVVILELTKNGQNVAFSNLDILLLFITEIIVTTMLAICLKFITDFLPQKIKKTLNKAHN